MLRLSDGTTVLSATDLTSHLACEHLFEQRRAIAHGERAKARPADDPHGDLVRRRGEEHERAQLHRLTHELGGCADLSGEVPFTRAGLEAAAARTRDAIAAGVPLVFQAQLFDGRWQGRADFLRRTPAGTYEVIDTKLARTVKPHVVHQLLLYSRLLTEAQGHAPERGHVLLGDGAEHVVELHRYAALHRRVAAEVERLAGARSRSTYPEPTAHCAICPLSAECGGRRRADDHLSLVAGIRRPQRDDLVDAGVATVAELAAASPGGEALDLLHHQAALQVRSRDSGEATHRHLTPARARGYARLPEPDHGDVFFDLEGDPYIGTDGGVEYLWGWSTAEGAYEHVWAHDADAEKAALEHFVATACARRARHPGMHVFHYAPHEASKLKSLATRYASCEDEIDDLLRNGVLVDLYAIVRQALQVGEESYSIKRLERHYGFARHEHTVRDGGGSIVAYEHWLGSGDDATLEAIRAYNEEDCRSTHALRDWLGATMRPEAETELGVRFADLAAPEADEPPQPPSWLPEQQELAGRLAAGLGADDALDTRDEAERRLLGQLLLYHHRESKPEWWRHFDLKARTAVELVDEREAIGCLRRDDSQPPTSFKKSLDYAFGFPPQEVKLAPDTLLDPTTSEQHSVVAIDDDRVVIRRGAGRPAPVVHALIGRGPVWTAVLRESLAEVAGSLLAGDGRFGAARSILRREPPPLPAAREPAIERMCAAALALESSHLVVQGPPGTGKTYRAARMIVAAMRARRRVGVTAQSHAAVQNLLHAVEAHAHEAGVAFRGVYKGHGYQSAHGLVERVETNAATQGEFDLVAGTAWLFARPEHRASLQLLFVDEAGQFSLAGAVAVAPCADSLVLLGDPQQLPQVTQAAHPGASGASVLEHLLGEQATVPPGRGFFLPESWRMHPDVCAFVSERSYDERLRSRAGCARRRVNAGGALAGAGLRFIATGHEGCGQRSVEEARAIGVACRGLLDGGTATDEHGVTRRLRPADLMVVAPYNLAATCIRAHVPHGVQVGTVDRFQGREAPVVFFAMTCSSGDDVPRGLDFLFSRNRLNVAVSRAQCLAVLVANPRLLHADCRTLEAMELVDGACRFAELATPVTPGDAQRRAA